MSKKPEFTAPAIKASTCAVYLIRSAGFNHEPGHFLNHIIRTNHRNRKNNMIIDNLTIASFIVTAIISSAVIIISKLQQTKAGTKNEC